MSNYLYQLVAKSFNLIDTIQPLVLSVFEPLPESTLDWEPSTLTTEETELETTSKADKFPNFESVQFLESRSPTTNLQIFEEITNPLSTNLTSTPVHSSRQIPKLTPDLAGEPSFELSLGEPFPESVLSQITTDNLLLTPNIELETNNTPPITAPTRLTHKQLTEIDSVVSSVQSPELRSQKQFLTQPFSESEMISPAINQVASSPNSDPLKPSPVAETEPSLSSRVISVLTTESNTSLLNPIDHQSQPKPKSLFEQPIEINRVASLYTLPSDFSHYMDKSTRNLIPDQASLLGNGENLKPLELQKRGLESEKFERRFPAMAEPMLRASKAFQDIGFAEPVKSHTSLQVQHLPQSPTQVQTETSTILSIPSVLQQEKFATENLHKQPTEINQVFTHSLSPQVESFELSPVQLQSEVTAMSTTGFANAQSPDSPQAIAPIIDRTLSNSHKQTLTSTIDRETNVRLSHSKLASDLPEIPQRFVHKNVLSIQPLLTDASPELSSLQTNSSTASFGDNLPSFVTSQPATQLTAIHSNIIPTPTPALHPSTAGIDIQPQVSFSNSHLSDFRKDEASVQEVGSQNHNTNYHKHTGIQKINRNEGIVSSPIDNLILPQNTSPNLSMYADRDKNGVQSSYFRQLEESDLRPLSGSINDVTVKSLLVSAASSKEDQKRYSEHLETLPVIQVTIGRLEVRSTAPVPPLPRPKPRPAPSVMSLNEYLRRRAGGNR